MSNWIAAYFEVVEASTYEVKTAFDGGLAHGCAKRLMEMLNTIIIMAAQGRDSSVCSTACQEVG